MTFIVLYFIACFWYLISLKQPTEWLLGGLAWNEKENGFVRTDSNIQGSPEANTFNKKFLTGSKFDEQVGIWANNPDMARLV